MTEARREVALLLIQYCTVQCYSDSFRSILMCIIITRPPLYGRHCIVQHCTITPVLTCTLESCGSASSARPIRDQLPGTVILPGPPLIEFNGQYLHRGDVSFSQTGMQRGIHCVKGHQHIPSLPPPLSTPNIDELADLFNGQ